MLRIRTGTDTELTLTVLKYCSKVPKALNGLNCSFKHKKKRFIVQQHIAIQIQPQSRGK